MNRGYHEQPFVAPRVPRGSGDEPSTRSITSEAAWCSPRERG